MSKHVIVKERQIFILVINTRYNKINQQKVELE